VGFALKLEVLKMKQAIITDKVPAAIGPYSLGIQAGKMVFLSGQLPIDSATNQLIEDDIQVQTRQILNNIQAILNAAGGSLANVVKTTIFLKDMDDFAAVNEAYGEFFTNPAPARSCVAVACLPKNADIEIEVIAVLP
jgi:2-iminobutanoate/2-iminopropanoate deaminase